MSRTRLHSSPLPSSPGAGRTSRKPAAFATGITIFITALVMLFSNGLLTQRPVHAFSKQTREAGAQLFEAKGCSHCHGMDGVGADRGPDLSDIGKRWKKDRIRQQIHDGGGGMPPFGEILQPDELTNIVDYLGSKRKITKTVKPPVPTKQPSDDGGI